MQRRDYISRIYRLVSSLTFCVVAISSARAQEESFPVTYGAFLDSYVAFDPRLDRGDRRVYTTQAYKNQEPSINLAYLESKLDANRYHGRFALQYGSSVDANYAAEPEEFWKYIQEAIIGVKLADGVWLDGGIHFSHIGLESWISKDNWSYTRSLVSEFSPYYQLGGRLSIDISPKTQLGLYLINGWQNISDGRHPALGMHLAHATDKYGTFAYNNFIGKEAGTRVLNDFVYSGDITESLSIAGAYDIGYQNLDTGGAWWSGVTALVRYKINSRVSTIVRFERFFDPHGVVALSVNDNSFNVSGASFGADYVIAKNFLLRSEVKALIGRRDMFPADSSTDSTGTIFVTSLSYYLNSDSP